MGATAHAMQLPHVPLGIRGFTVRQYNTTPEGKPPLPLL